MEQIKQINSYEEQPKGNFLNWLEGRLNKEIKVIDSISESFGSPTTEVKVVDTRRKTKEVRDKVAGAQRMIGKGFSPSTAFSLYDITETVYNRYKQ